VKAAAPQAPTTAQVTAKSGAKTAARAKTASPASSSTSATGFDRILARAVATGRETPGANAGAAARQPAPGVVVPEQTAETARKGASNRTTARTPARARADDGTATERTGAEAPRTASPVGTAAATAAAHAASAAASTATAATVAPAKQAEPRIHVIDLRKKPGTSGDPEAMTTARKASPEKADAAGPATKPFAERLAAAEPKPAAAAPARATPLERLREMTGSDLVKTAGLVVRDGGGEIRLTLKPESLGSVRIRLSLEDGKVEGRIVVDTPEARLAFEAGIEGLTRALQADGFQTGALQVSVSGGNANDSRQAAGLLGDTIAAARLRATDGLSAEDAIVSGWTGDGLVNVYA
jgi:flagellar hook-length control protein FliK